MKFGLGWIVALAVMAPAVAEDRPQKFFVLTPETITVDVKRREITVEVKTNTGGWEVKASPKKYVQKPDWWQVDIIGEKPGNFATQAICTHKVVVSIDKFQSTKGADPVSIAGKEGVEVGGVRIGIK